jgi:hypothetical protein
LQSSITVLSDTVDEHVASIDTIDVNIVNIQNQLPTVYIKRIDTINDIEVPQFTSNNTVINDSPGFNTWSSGLNPWFVFNKSLADNWGDEMNTSDDVFISLQMDDGYLLNYYTILGRTDADTQNGVPTSWILEGGNGGGNWFEIETRSDEIFIFNVERTFTPYDDAPSYIYYRLVFTKSYNEIDPSSSHADIF